jgi:hypothetical protein
MITRRHFLVSGGIAHWSKFVGRLIGLSPMLLYNDEQAHGGGASNFEDWLTMNLAHAITAKDNELFLVCRPDGSIPADGGQGHGLFYHD